jgi:predicted GH43/DUF377 family glycosyl hydrolase
VRSAIFPRDSVRRLRSNTASLPRRRPARARTAGTALPSASAFALALLFLAPTLAPAAVAYSVSDPAFTGGALNATITFPPGATTASGPSLHLLANATFQGASMDVTGLPYTTNATVTRSSTAEFNAGQERTHLAVSFGTMSLATTGAVTVFNASNGFGNGTMSNTALAAGRLVLTGALNGTYTTPTLDALGAPWGFVFADGRALPPSSVSFNVLDPNATVVVGGLKSGARVPLSLDLYPSVKLQLVLATSDPLVQPEVVSFGIGQRAADYLIPGNVSNGALGTTDLGDLVRTLPAAANLTKDASNPVVTTQAATYYSQYLSQPFVLPMNGSYSMYFAAGTNVGHSGAGIGRATSFDLRNWTVDGSPLLTPTAASYDAFALTHPYVFPNPEGSGYLMLYTAWTSSLSSQLARATSSDGVNWTKTGVVLGPAASGWDNFAVGMAARVDYAPLTDTYTLYYSGTSAATGGGNALGRATSSDGITWTRDGANPVMARGGPGAVDQDDAQGGKITSWAGTLFYYYSCNNGGYSTCLATSADGSSWSKVGRVINTTAAAFDSAYAADADAVIAANGTLIVFYAGFDGSSSKIGRAIAPFQAGEWTGRFDLLAGPTPDWVTFTKDASNPIIPVSPATYYSGYLSQPQVVKMGASWWMYLSAGQGPGFAGAGIARATSDDLAAWTMDAQPLLNRTNTTYDAGGLIHPYVLENPFGSGYLMYYTGVSASGTFSIDLATSPDALNWTKVGAVLNGSGFGWDSAQVAASAYVKYNSSADRLRMWYAGYDSAGGSATGIASSPDGVTWTRITFQPVLPRGGAGSVDQNMAQGGKIIEMRGTLVFYYTCNPGIGRINSCMAQSLDGGFSFTKRGAVLNTSVSAFDSVYAADPAAVLTDNALLLFYAGWDGSKSQIGVARGAFDPSAPNAWLGAPQQLPRSIAAFAANATAGAGVTLSLSVRSSLDGIQWSNYETVSAADTTVNTQVQRYLMYRATFSAGTGPSVFRSAAFNLTSNFESGRYRSELLSFNASVDRVLVDINTGGSGRLDWYVEAGALGTVATLPNDWVNVTGGGFALVVRIDFWGASSETPTVLAFTLRTETDGLPSDVTVEAGVTAPARLVASGALSGTRRVTIPGADLAAAVAAAIAAYPYITSTDVLLNLTSTHFGRLRLSNLSVDYTLKNPITATYLPASTTVTAHENEASFFSVNATTCCGAVINYSWYVDGVLQAPLSPTNLSWTPSFTGAGPHDVTLVLANGDTTVTRRWNVNVLTTDRPPVVDVASPSGDPSASHASVVVFGVEASDPDGDALTFAWAADGVPLEAPSNQATVSGLPAGLHDVTVTIFDGVLNTTHSWALTLTDSPPDATYTPDTPLSASHRATVTFAVVATDPDGDAVSYRWTVRGQPRSETTSSLSVTAPAPGSLTVGVVVTGGGASVTHDWQVEFTDAAPTATFGPDGPLSGSHSASVEFSVNGSDADGDPLSYSWAVDGVAVTSALGPRFTLAGAAPGTHNISVSVLAGALSITHRWTLTSTNGAPDIASKSPSGAAGQNSAAAQSFSLQATDADGDPLTYAWTLNGAPANVSGSTFALSPGLAPGSYAVAVTVSDGQGGAAATTWSFVVPAPTTGSASLGSGLLFVLVGLAAAAAVAFVLIRKRRKGGEG